MGFLACLETYGGFWRAPGWVFWHVLRHMEVFGEPQGGFSGMSWYIWRILESPRVGFLASLETYGGFWRPPGWVFWQVLRHGGFWRALGWVFWHVLRQMEVYEEPQGGFSSKS